MLAGVVGSLDVVGVLVGLLTGKGLLARRAMARVALDDGLSVGTLVSGTLGPAAVVNLAHFTLSIGVSSGSLLVIGCPERLGNVTKQKRCKVSTSNLIEGCQSAAIAIRLVLQSSADVRPYFTTIQLKHWRKTAFGSIIRSCL